MSYTAEANRYDGRMAYRRCGHSGVLVPEISLGCWHNFGASDDAHEARAILRRAFDCGITHFDLANNYGPPPGSAEENVGRLLAGDFAAHRDELLIASKAGHLMWPGPYGEWTSRKHLLASLDQSLRRLRLDYVDIFYAHRPDPHTPLEETVGALASAVASGRALYVGLSKFPLPMLQQAVAMLAQQGVRCLVYQPPYSLLNRWVEASGIHAWLAGQGIGSMVFSPLAQGMLTGKYLAGMASGSRAARPEGFLQPEQVEAAQARVAALAKLAARRGQPLHHLALQWVIQQPGVTSAIIGARTVAQLDDNLRAMQGAPLSQAELAELDAIAPADPAG